MQNGTLLGINNKQIYIYYTLFTIYVFIIFMLFEIMYVLSQHIMMAQEKRME